MINISRIIKVTEYTAAWTLVDGACGMRSIFGLPEAGSGRIECPQVRDLLVKHQT